MLTALVALAYWLAAGAAAGQQPGIASQAGPQVAADGSLQSVWQFGLRITATAPTTQLVATVPVPQEWPEQSVEVISEDRSPTVNRVEYRDLDGLARQMVIRVNRLAAGETAEATVTMRVVKRPPRPPDRPDQLVLPPRGGPLVPFLRPSPFIESNHHRIRQLAGQLERPDATAWDQVHEIYLWVRENIQYEFDEEIRTTLEALDRGRGDCEELSSLFIALCRSLGIPARAVWIPEHTYPEFYLLDGQGEGRWYPCQAAGDEAFGEMLEWRPILQKGDNFRLQGFRQPQRYVQPTAIGHHHPDAPPQIQWIMRPE